MSLAWYIVLEQPLPNISKVTNGNALAHAAEVLNVLAKNEGVRPLMSFFSASKEEYAAIAGFESAMVKDAPQEQWFSPADGLRTVRALIRAAPDGDVDRRVIDDLMEFDSILEIAAQHGVRWHLGIDF